MFLMVEDRWELKPGELLNQPYKFSVGRVLADLDHPVVAWVSQDGRANIGGRSNVFREAFRPVVRDELLDRDQGQPGQRVFGLRPCDLGASSHARQMARRRCAFT